MSDYLLWFVILLFILVIILFNVVNTLLDAVKTNQLKIKEVYSYLNKGSNKQIGAGRNERTTKGTTRSFR